MERICLWLQMEEMLDHYKRQLEQKDREILQLARYAWFLYCLEEEVY